MQKIWTVSRGHSKLLCPAWFQHPIIVSYEAFQLNSSLLLYFRNSPSENWILVLSFNPLEHLLNQTLSLSLPTLCKNASHRRWYPALNHGHSLCSLLCLRGTILVSRLPRCSPSSSKCLCGRFRTHGVHCPRRIKIRVEEYASEQVPRRALLHPRCSNSGENGKCKPMGRFLLFFASIILQQMNDRV